MSTQPVIPAPPIVAYEPNPTVTSVFTGQVQKLQPKVYATIAAAYAVVKFLSSDQRTSGFGPITVTEQDQSNPWWRYSVPIRWIVIGNGSRFDAATWYGILADGNPIDIQNAINEMTLYASGQDIQTGF